ncbi:Calx-beta domain-containing protein [Candidatus Marithrix sp. Canyon 246]|uniref:Calx-beta domain-containing protein n=1 Tax=Candidatus Marithrix sp. Canyon 246 TaxID=1827136 RepID=UPI00084A1339|nr:hypothetical protein [Candidatus Marithrix sp. Canyon 246]
MATAFAADKENLASEGSAGKFEFTSKIYFANEQSKNAIVKVARKGGSNGVVSVNYATAEGYLIWGNGDNEIKTFKVPLFDDVDEEGDETVNLVLNSPIGAVLGDQKTAKLKIADDECHGVFSTKARTLYIPLVTVQVYDSINGKPTEDVQIFEATFTYDWRTRTFQIPYVDLPSILGPKMVIRINIEEMPVYNPEGLMYLQIGDYQYLYTYDSE